MPGKTKPCTPIHHLSKIDCPFRYVVPLDFGYSTQFKEESVVKYSYPDGNEWRKLFQEGKYNDPSLQQKQFSMIKDSGIKMFEQKETKYIF